MKIGTCKVFFCVFLWFFVIFAFYPTKFTIHHSKITIYNSPTIHYDLATAHRQNDEVLERIYKGRVFKNDTERLETLFEMYTKMTGGK